VFGATPAARIRWSSSSASAQRFAFAMPLMQAL